VINPEMPGSMAYRRGRVQLEPWQRETHSHCFICRFFFCIETFGGAGVYELFDSSFCDLITRCSTAESSQPRGLSGMLDEPQIHKQTWKMTENM
jgi:hypothetical protein